MKMLEGILIPQSRGRWITVAFENLAVEDEGAQLKGEISGPKSKISDFSLKLFTRWIRLVVRSFSPLFLLESGLRLPGVRRQRVPKSREVQRVKHAAAGELPAVRWTVMLFWLFA